MVGQAALAVGSVPVTETVEALASAAALLVELLVEAAFVGPTVALAG